MILIRFPRKYRKSISISLLSLTNHSRFNFFWRWIQLLQLLWHLSKYPSANQSNVFEVCYRELLMIKYKYNNTLKTWWNWAKLGEKQEKTWTNWENFESPWRSWRQTECWSAIERMLTDWRAARSLSRWNSQVYLWTLKLLARCLSDFHPRNLHHNWANSILVW